MRHGKRCTASKFIGAELGNLMNGFSSTDSVPTQQTGVNLFAELNNRNYTFRVTPFVNDSLNVDSETNDFPILQDMFPYLQPIKPFFSNYSGVEMVLGPGYFSCNRACRILEEVKIVLWLSLPVGWVLSGPLHSSIVVPVTTFKCIGTSICTRVLYGTFKHADPNSATDKRAQKLLNSTMFHNSSRYLVEILTPFLSATICFKICYSFYYASESSKTHFPQ